MCAGDLAIKVSGYFPIALNSFFTVDCTCLLSISSIVKNVSRFIFRRLS